MNYKLYFRIDEFCQIYSFNEREQWNSRRRQKQNGENCFPLCVAEAQNRLRAWQKNFFYKYKMMEIDSKINFWRLKFKEWIKLFI